jgi:hypothetical protein
VTIYASIRKSGEPLPADPAKTILPILISQAGKLETILNRASDDFRRLGSRFPKSGSEGAKNIPNHRASAKTCFQTAKNDLITAYIPFGLQKIRQRFSYGCRLFLMLTTVSDQFCELKDPPQVLTAQELKLTLRWDDWLLLYDEVKDVVDIPSPPREPYSVTQRLNFHRFLFDFIIRWGLVIGYFEQKGREERAAASVSSGGSGNTSFSTPLTNPSDDYLTRTDVKQAKSHNYSKPGVEAISTHGELLRRLLETDSYIQYLKDLAKLKQSIRGDHNKDTKVEFFDEDTKVEFFNEDKEIRDEGWYQTRQQRYLDKTLLTMVSHVCAADTLLNSILSKSHDQEQPLTIKFRILEISQWNEQDTIPTDELLRCIAPNNANDWACNTYDTLLTPPQSEQVELSLLSNYTFPLSNSSSQFSSSSFSLDSYLHGSKSPTDLTEHEAAEQAVKNTVEKRRNKKREKKRRKEEKKVEHKVKEKREQVKKKIESQLQTFRGTVHCECSVMLYLINSPEVLKVRSIVLHHVSLRA